MRAGEAGVGGSSSGVALREASTSGGKFEAGAQIVARPAAGGSGTSAVRTAGESSSSAASVPAVRRHEAVSAGDLAVPDTSRLGKVLRRDAVPEGSKLEYLGPGRIRFDGVEFRAVRDLSHLSEGELQEMLYKGNPHKDIKGCIMHGHHFDQLSHRDPKGFIIKIPKSSHSYTNKIQHPKPLGEGLPLEARKEWDAVLRKAYYKERARTELLNGGH